MKAIYGVNSYQPAENIRLTRKKKTEAKNDSLKAQFDISVECTELDEKIRINRTWLA